jgi:hypothetical protein
MLLIRAAVIAALTAADNPGADADVKKTNAKKKEKKKNCRSRRTSEIQFQFQSQFQFHLHSPDHLIESIHWSHHLVWVSN